LIVLDILFPEFPTHQLNLFGQGPTKSRPCDLLSSHRGLQLLSYYEYLVGI